LEEALCDRGGDDRGEDDDGDEERELFTVWLSPVSTSTA
jgi:hypothetical protein